MSTKANGNRAEGADSPTLTLYTFYIYVHIKQSLQKALKLNYMLSDLVCWT